MMKEKVETKVRDSHFPIGLFAAIYGILLLSSGIHTGIIQLFTVWNPGGIIKTLIPLLYWCAISLVVAAFTRIQMKKYYEIPMKDFAKATAEVAQGDFGVYLPPIHTPDKLDYLDVMIMDFNKMVEELGSIETLKTDFFSNVSHEIKTPIAVISNYAQLLEKQGGLSAEQEEEVDGILQASHKLNKLIANILKLNRLEKQSIQPETEEYDLSAQLCDCTLQFENQWEEKNIEFDVDIEDKVCFEADRSLMELVWNNLISNAIKFTEPGGKVTLKETSAADEIVVKISDTGCGMKEATLKHIFDKFYQGDTSHTTEGNGLGLAMVKRSLDILGGSIEAESKENVGTTFTVTLPKTRGII
mgnify:CR=1 FL=1|jgi:signal transduction histidine kinase